MPTIRPAHTLIGFSVSVVPWAWVAPAMRPARVSATPVRIDVATFEALRNHIDAAHPLSRAWAYSKPSRTC
jgi:hypothetical protein